MAADSKIEWTDHTFNPWIGCTKVSPACDHCYAEVSTPSRTLGVVWGPGQPRRRTSPGNWLQPLRWNAQADAFRAQHGRRQRVFCASLADVFDNEVPDFWRADLFDLIEATPNLDWLLLTKRIGNVPDMMRRILRPGTLPPHVWLGATICNQPEADRDITKLLAVDARVRFLSMEPLLGPVDLGAIPWRGLRTDVLRGWSSPEHGLHWVIVGGESGPQARPMHPEWARSLRDQCQAAGVPFLFKQWGEWLPLSHQTGGADPEQRQCHVWPDGRAYDGEREEMTPACAQLSRVGKKAAGRELDGRTWDEVPG
ncbi:MAG: phage Gp37/Gp68 family protein [Hydrogenophaga sp.]|uniref:phage Gp37/Gp68 family protein n=1 Tax=Hydrogenophaga sp. TaxID=1904254 RepID=UPI001DE9D4A3|nr:phage Gp37/Gp68 family protein [Hydrogenophaga sp.]MBX3610356.1 phage Gp37/Gp68 family protein [Hydrogenophaga sp.]